MDDGLEALVGEWLPLPNVAERLGTEVGKVRRLLQDGVLVAVRGGEPAVLRVPAALLVPDPDAEGPDGADPDAEGPDGADPDAEGPDGADPVDQRLVPLPQLQGTLSVLRDSGYDDEAVVRWLFTPDDSLPGPPVQALREGRKTEVRRRAQALAF